MAGSTLPHPRPTSSSSGWRPLITARYFSSCPPDSASRRTPCPPGLASGGFRSALAVSDFRLRARLGFSIPSSPRPARSYPRFWIRRSSFERRRDLNPPESRAAQRTICLVHSPGSANRTSSAAPALLEFRQIMLGPAQNRGVRQRDASVRHHDDQISQAQFEARLPAHTQDDDLSIEMPSLE